MITSTTSMPILKMAQFLFVWASNTTAVRKVESLIMHKSLI
ncbi:MAG: hypothetical protein ACTHKK_02895 [Candidatus Nitrosocosmicus sp.]